MLEIKRFLMKRVYSITALRLAPDHDISVRLRMHSFCLFHDVKLIRASGVNGNTLH